MESNLIDANGLNGLSLAYIGDAIYEVYIREYILSLGFQKVNDLHKKVIKFTSGEAQAKIIHKMMETNELSEFELQIFKRGRNSHVHSARKNISLQDYLDATGFEALLGYTYLKGDKERLNRFISIAKETITL